ncbi:hypothetical protein COP2_048063 [Malus domestica]
MARSPSQLPCPPPSNPSSTTPPSPSKSSTSPKPTPQWSPASFEKSPPCAASCFTLLLPSAAPASVHASSVILLAPLPANSPSPSSKFIQKKNIIENGIVEQIGAGTM